MSMLRLLHIPRVEVVDFHSAKFEKISRFRYQTYCKELRFLDEKDYPDGRETDKYDQYSTHIVVFMGKNIAGYVRVIEPDGLESLPIFEHFDVERPRTRKICEISRFVVSPEYRKHKTLRRLITLKLMGRMKETIENKDLSIIYAVVEEWLYKSLVKRGYEFKKITDGHFHMGAITYPIKLEME